MNEIVSALLPLLILLLVIYFLAVRPRRRNAAAHAAMVRRLAVDDLVMTSSGIRGRVVGWQGPRIRVEVAPGVTADIEPVHVESVTGRAEPAGPARCANCREALDPEDQFCGHCGTPVKPVR